MKFILGFLVFLCLCMASPVRAFQGPGLDLSGFRLTAPVPDGFQIIVGNHDLQRFISAVNSMDQCFFKTDLIGQSPMRYLGYRSENFFGFTILFS